jgi:hypothetical protein
VFWNHGPSPGWGFLISMSDSVTEVLRFSVVKYPDGIAAYVSTKMGTAPVVKAAELVVADIKLNV